jgi:hypothetical protein
MQLVILFMYVFGMLIVDVSEVKLPGEAFITIYTPECGQPFNGRDTK